MCGGVISLLSISCILLMFSKSSAQSRISCLGPTACDGWLYHVNKIGIGGGWTESYLPRNTLFKTFSTGKRY
ncbi:MAG: hypothetical protein N2449_07695 [Bacteroidales bacterium]|nr:hypothetical protein [Bacteroidales bacterium]